MRILVDYGADVNSESNDHFTPFGIAIARMNFDVLNLLLDEKKLDLTKISLNDKSIYHHMAAIMIHPEGWKVFEKVCKIVGNVNKDG